MINDHCPVCLGEGEVFSDAIADWVKCEPCEGTGKRKKPKRGAK